MHCQKCKQNVVTRVSYGVTYCSICSAELLPCPHTAASVEGIYRVCVACGKVLEENHFGFSDSEPESHSDTEDAVGGSGDYGDRQNPTEDPPWIK
jgi:hypothetical protein